MRGPPRTRRRSGSCAVQAAAWLRELTPSLSRMLATCRLTVCGERSNARAISLLLSPAAIRASTPLAALSGESAEPGVLACACRAAATLHAPCCKATRFGRRQLVAPRYRCQPRQRTLPRQQHAADLSLSSAAASAGRIAAAAAPATEREQRIRVANPRFLRLPSGRTVAPRPPPCPTTRRHPPAVRRVPPVALAASAGAPAGCRVRHCRRWHARREGRTRLHRQRVDRRIA